jgi:hypothetical protein
MASHAATGYGNDVPCARSLTRELAPAWLDFVVTLSDETGRSVSRIAP